MITRASILAALVLLFPALSKAQWNSDWPYRKSISINASDLGETILQPTVVLRLHSGNFNFMDARTDGSDLRFIAGDDKTPLKFHIEKFDPVNEIAVAWIQLPKLDPAEKDAHIWLYYGNDKASPLTDVSGIWDPSSTAVWHFDESEPLRDITDHRLSAAGSVGLEKAGLLGDSAILDGKPLVVASNPFLKLSANGGFTYSAWIKPASLPQQAILYSQGPNIALGIAGQTLQFVVGQVTVAGGDIKPNVWQHVAVTVGSGSAALYIDGKQVDSKPASLADTQADVKIGDGYTGELDELELADVARSPAWIKTVANNQGSDNRLLEIREDSPGNAEHGISYFGVLFHNLTIDAWVIILILAMMLVVSGVVIVGKAKLVAHAERHNRNFLSRYRNETGNILGLDSAGDSDSPIFRLYSAGLKEIRKRYMDAPSLSLSGASIDAIKAAIDADLVRETDRLNEKMVLLTIAISGGPFLGLLGTVVGVMITFASIAAAGDVNVNAIAPGIAAALLATVAGLGVAIPSLFGYNYLASRIKRNTSDMQIFVDEFITRVAELYGR